MLAALASGVHAQEPPSVPLVSAPVTQPEPVPVFESAGWWGEYVLYSVSVCNGTDGPISIRGNTLWAFAQRNRLRPLTHSQMQQAVDESARKSPSYIVRTVVAAAAGLTTAAQAGDLIGEKWAARYQAIAPTVGAAMVITGLIVDRQQKPTLTIPEGYLPPVIDVPRNDCWIGSIAGRQLEDQTP